MKCIFQLHGDGVHEDGGIGHSLIEEMDGLPITYAHHFYKLAIFLEVRHGIKSAKLIETEHMYGLLDYMAEVGFAESTVKNYIIGFRAIHRQCKNRFSDDFIPPSIAGYEEWKRQRGYSN